MPKQLLADWLAALRSGEYKKGCGLLHNEITNQYCCLGVLAAVANVSVSGWAVLYADDKAAMGATFINRDGDNACAPYLPSLELLADAANDSGDYTFPEIADAIEACAEGV